MRAFGFNRRIVQSSEVLPLPSMPEGDPFLRAFFREKFPLPSPTHWQREYLTTDPEEEAWAWCRFTDQSESNLLAEYGQTLLLDCMIEEGKLTAYSHWPSLHSLQAHRFVTNFLPAWCNLFGDCILHAAGVSLDGSGCLIVAPTASGKSSACYGFASQYGGDILSDDAVAVFRNADGAWGIRGTHPSLRLRKTSLEGLNLDSNSVRKCADSKVSPAEDRIAFQSEAQLEGIFFLDAQPEQAEFSVTELDFGNTIARLNQSLHRFATPMTERLLFRSSMNTLGALVGSVPAFRVTYPHRWDALELLILEIRDLLLRAKPTL